MHDQPMANNSSIEESKHAASVQKRGRIHCPIMRKDSLDDLIGGSRSQEEEEGESDQENDFSEKEEMSRNGIHERLKVNYSPDGRLVSSLKCQACDTRMALGETRKLCDRCYISSLERENHQLKSQIALKK